MNNTCPTCGRPKLYTIEECEEVRKVLEEHILFCAEYDIECEATKRFYRLCFEPLEGE